ncbi:MAG: AAA family ATPase [Saprospiraceae bacterium]|nr:AAA family ATPase [Saprospiraceae bacterium]
MKTLAFFNNKGGVGKTTLIYHLSWMFAELGQRVLAVDLDPQANLSAMMLSEAMLYEKVEDKLSLVEAFRPLIKGIGDIQPAHIEPITSNIDLLIGNLELSSFEDRFSDSWAKCLDKQEPAFRFTSAFHRIIQEAAARVEANYVLIDVGPNLGSINRAALIASNYIIFPVAADLFSVQGMSNVGKTVGDWSEEWRERQRKNPDRDIVLPNPETMMQPLGYVVSQHGLRERRPVKAYQNWANKIPFIYQRDILHHENAVEGLSIEEDENCLSLLKHYRSLMAMAMEVNKPVFLLKPADGAIGAHLEGVRRAYDDFKILSNIILDKLNSLSPQ